MGSFPDLRDAFDPDELPLEFIVNAMGASKRTNSSIDRVECPIVRTLGGGTSPGCDASANDGHHR
jgi:hypothetical protein